MTVLPHLAIIRKLTELARWLKDYGDMVISEKKKKALEASSNE